MSSELVWLHVSDLHADPTRSKWDSDPVTKALLRDIKRLRDERGLTPQFVFFTGDAAFGHRGTQPGQTMPDQFRAAHEFLDQICKCFDPPISLRNLYLVPGNHDVHRGNINRFDTRFLQDKNCTLDNVVETVQAAGNEWRSILQRLSDYRTFLETKGYDHLQAEPSLARWLTYADARKLPDDGRLHIGGLNSAWSSTGDGETEKGQLWMAGEFQIRQVTAQFPQEPNAIRIGLVHHPLSWLRAAESRDAARLLEQEFPIVLHGHEHDQWVHEDARTGHVRIAAGSCYQGSKLPNGYNVGRIDLANRTGEVWLREYDARNGEWKPLFLTDITDERGVWQLQHADRWLPKNDSATVPASPPITPASEPTSPATALDAESEFERRYCEAVVRKLDSMELFGLPKGADMQPYPLSVAYVSLTLSRRGPIPDDEAAARTLKCDQLFNEVGVGGKRLLVRGQAGSGKTTLMHWAAVQAAKQLLENGPSGSPILSEFDNASSGTSLGLPSRADWADLLKWEPRAKGHVPGSTTTGTWSFAVFGSPGAGKTSAYATLYARLLLREHWKFRIPFVVPLRYCQDGRLPRPEEMPSVLFRNLPDPPPGWMDRMLKAGRAMVLFDGIDEVRPECRPHFQRDLKEFIQEFPENLYLVTTRPSAVDEDESWLIDLTFSDATIEPLSPNDRTILIDRWHTAVEQRLRELHRPADLQPLATALKQRLQDEPQVATLARWPLLCAALCALHRDRRQNVPRKEVELCEELCKLLIDRREKERPGLDDEPHASAEYRHLDYGGRMSLLSRIAVELLERGDSALPEDEADALIAKELSRIRSRETSTASAIRESLIERSGVLCERAPGQLDFLHNALKEFAAADRLVNAGDVMPLVEHRDHEAWRRVAAYAVALPRTGSPFATKLMRELLKLVKQPAKAKRGDSSLIALKPQRILQTWLYRLSLQAAELDPDVRQELEDWGRRLLPPLTFTDAELLGECGDGLADELTHAKQKTQKAAVRAACVRALGLMNTPKSLRLLDEYRVDGTSSVQRELAEFVNPLELSLVQRQLLDDGNLPEWVRRDRTTDLSPLASLTSLQSLDLRGTRVSDVSLLASFTALQSLDLSATPVTDVSPLASLTALQWLDLSGTTVSDVSLLASLTALQALNLSGTRIVDASPLASLTSLQTLNLSGTKIVDVSPLASLTGLKDVDLRGTGLADASPLSSLIQLKELDLGATKVTDVSPLACLTSLRELVLRDTSVECIVPLAKLTNLEILDLGGTNLVALTPLRELTTLWLLNLHMSRFPDIHVLSQLTSLTWLSLGFTNVKDVSPLSKLTSLQDLDLGNTEVTDVLPLTSLTALRYLDLSDTRVADVSPLRAIAGLTIRGID